MGLLLALLVNLVAFVAALLTLGSAAPRRPDGRRGGPVPQAEPNDDDRRTVAEIQRRSAEERQRELDDAAEAAEPSGVPPSDEQRQNVLDVRQRSAEVRGPVARSLRRQPLAVGVVYDDERATVEDLHADARDERLGELADRGIVDPSVEHETAGMPPELPNLPGSELFGYFDCGNCGKQVERAYPGYVDWDAASRDLVCPDCGAIVVGATTQEAEPKRSSSSKSSKASKSSKPSKANAAESAEASSSSPPLTDAERAELEQLRRDQAERDKATPDKQPDDPPKE